MEPWKYNLMKIIGTLYASNVSSHCGASVRKARNWAPYVIKFGNYPSEKFGYDVPYGLSG